MNMCSKRKIKIKAQDKPKTNSWDNLVRSKTARPGKICICNCVPFWKRVYSHKHTPIYVNIYIHWIWKCSEHAYIYCVYFLQNIENKRNDEKKKRKNGKFSKIDEIKANEEQNENKKVKRILFVCKITIFIAIFLLLFSFLFLVYRKVYRIDIDIIWATNNNNNHSKSKHPAFLSLDHSDEIKFMTNQSNYHHFTYYILVEGCVSDLQALNDFNECNNRIRDQPNTWIIFCWPCGVFKRHVCKSIVACCQLFISNHFIFIRNLNKKIKQLLKRHMIIK